MNKKGKSKIPEIVINRTFKAKLDKVWKAWTDPQILMIWWGPKAFTTPVFKVDLRVNGKLLSCMRSPDRKDFWGTGVYKEIEPMTKLVYTDSFSDAEGNVVPAAHYGMSGKWPLELLVTVKFKEKGDDTEMELVHAGIPDGTMSEMTKAGWNESFDKLEEYLETGKVMMPKTILIANPGVQEIIIRRTLDAPRDLVFKAYTSLELIPQWWGPAKYKTIVERLEARSGGSWRFIQKDSEGNIFAFRGVFHEVIPSERIIQTFEFEPMAGHVELQVATFDEKDGKTTFNAKSIYLSVEDRDGELRAGMEAGMNEGFDRLDALLAKLKHK
jgi:uncharacterized protein YndB with AHSA1/START domain